jgi:hypothetical protein
MTRNLAILIITFFILHFETKAQSESKDLARTQRFKTIGGVTGWGFSISENTDYQTYYFIADYSSSFKVPKKKDFVSWYAEPQFNLVKAGSTPKGSLDYEFGLNLGIRNYVKINEGFYFYQMLGSGPHYVSAEIGRQANGFIFSDNLALGTFLRLNQKGLFLNFQYVQRHISNAGLKDPNGGVNSCNFVIGLSRLK